MFWPGPYSERPGRNRVRNGSGCFRSYEQAGFFRRRGRYWWGNSVVDICQSPRQFSCWNSNDPNHKIIRSVAENDIVFAVCKRIAQRAVSGMLGIIPTALPITIPGMCVRAGRLAKFPVPKSALTFFITILRRVK